MSPRPPEGAAAREVIRWAMETFGSTLAVATSLGAEDMVLLHEVAHLRREHGLALPHVFFLDTGRLHEETYALLAAAQARYAVPIEVYFPGAPLVESLVRKQGVLGFRASVEARKECC
ncbi:MAG: phosphoadenosine phosphosulfate reductase family protein, partial [Polyangiaceae bacterium]|nr:phosphoadenosine phosphosulfate reductase family protein [Polyangiaceae bacterium]